MIKRYSANSIARNGLMKDYPLFIPEDMMEVVSVEVQNRSIGYRGFEETEKDKTH